MDVFNWKCTASVQRQNVPKMSFNAGPDHQKNILKTTNTNLHGPKPEKKLLIRGPDQKIGGTGALTGKTGIEKGPRPEKNLLIDRPGPEKRIYRGLDRKNAQNKLPDC